MKKISLKIKFSGIMIALGLFCAGAVGLTMLFKSSETISDISSKYIKNVFGVSAVTIEKFLEDYWYVTETSAHALEAYDGLSPDSRRTYINSMLKNIVAKYSDIQAAWCIWETDVLEGNDRAYASVPGSQPNGRFAPYWFRSGNKIEMVLLEGTDVPDGGEMYQFIKSTGEMMLLEPYEYEVGGKMVLMTSISAPIYTADRSRLLGVAGVDISIAKIQEISQAVKPFDGTLTGIWSNEGIIAGHFNIDNIGKKVYEADKELYGPYLDDYLKALKEGREFSFSIKLPKLGNQTLFFMPVKVGTSTTPWGFGVALPTSTIMAPVYKMIKLSIIVTLVITVLIVLLSALFANSITKPLIKVTNTIKDISEGEGDLTYSIEVKSRDEVGDLAFYFNELMQVLREPISKTKAAVEHLVSSSKDLFSVSQNLSASSEQTVSQSTNVAGTAEEMSMNINAMASGAEQASVNANEVASAAEQMSSNMNSVASSVEEMTASINKIANNAGEARRVALNATTKSDEATSVMSKLGSAAKEIGHVTDVIKKIADKTNLLALNATIEAASAGESGKGFAVVAGEIKELANQSAKSADDITSRIEGIQTGTSDAVNVIRDVSEIIAQINQSIEAIAGYVNQQTKASNEIANNVSQASTSAKRVASAIGEVAKGSHDIARNATEAAKGATDVSHNVSSMKEAAHDSCDGASKINASADGLSKMADDLRKLMSRFKV
jgi:methyl-accepting chemotaxis protein